MLFTFEFHPMGNKKEPKCTEESLQQLTSEFIFSFFSLTQKAMPTAE